MGGDVVVIPNILNSRPSMLACWVDDAGLAGYINSYVRVQQVRVASIQTTLLYSRLQSSSEPFAIPNFQNGQPLMAAYWADNARTARELDSRVQRARMAHAQTISYTIDYKRVVT